MENKFFTIIIKDEENHIYRSVNTRYIRSIEYSTKLEAARVDLGEFNFVIRKEEYEKLCDLLNIEY